MINASKFNFENAGRDNGEMSKKKISIKLLHLYLVQQLHQIKAQQFYTDLGLH